MSTKIGRKKKNPPTIHLVECVDLINRRSLAKKCIDPRNLIVSVHIDEVFIPNTLIDLEVSINIMTAYTMKQLELTNFCATLIALDLTDRYRIKQEGFLDNVICPSIRGSTQWILWFCRLNQQLEDIL